MATPRSARKHLEAIGVPLLQGIGWRKPTVMEDVLKIAHVLRCMRLSDKLACSYMCIKYPAVGAYIMLPVKEAPHESIPKLKSEQTVDFSCRGSTQKCRTSP